MSRVTLFRRLALPSSAIVVTPNRRLARALGRAFDAWQARQGRVVWETARIVPFAAFVAGLHEAAQHDPALTGVRAPLAAAQEQALWEAVVEASGAALASTARAAALAADGWTLAHRWRVADRLPAYAFTEDTRLFSAWAAEYERRVDRMGAVDQARLPDLVRARVDADGRVGADAVLLAGFVEPTPQQAALFEALAAAGIAVERVDDGRTAGQCRRIEAADPRDELERMADWTAERLASNPQARIGIVVPDLSARRDAVTRALDATLRPDALLDAPDRARPYTVSLGEPLADAPLVATALRVLRLAVDALEFAEASALLRSPYVDFGAPPERARFDIEWRRRAGHATSLDRLIAAARGAAAVPAALRGALEALGAWRHRVGTRTRRLSEWASLLTEALRAAGFPGTATLDSNAFQALARWRELLTEYAALERVAGAVDPRAAVNRLARIAAGTVFQPEGGDPPVHVLGALEAAGLEFDHLWIAGMTSEAWPLPARPHPLLPLPLQRAQRMPGALAEVELQRARVALDGLVRAAPEVVASHARSDGDRVLEPAPMIAAWPAGAVAPPAARARDVLASAPLEVRPDAAAPPLSGREVVGGGAATLADQAACPFRAFARHRLRAEEPVAPHDGLDAAERGELVHRTLAVFWESLPERTRAHLASLSPGELAAAVERATDQALARLRERRLDDPGAGLLALERRRLVNLVTQWLQFELASRTDFTVVATEERRALAIGPLSLRGRLDRIDRLPDGRTIVIDYKTGGPSSPRAWLGPRPDEPQLPLYLVASETGARGIAFARLRAGERRFVALTEEASMLPHAGVDWMREHPTWSALVDAWRDELTRLAEAFAAGAADVAPKQAQTCRHCEVALLCRFNERVGERADDLTAHEAEDE